MVYEFEMYKNIYKNFCWGRAYMGEPNPNSVGLAMVSDSHETLWNSSKLVQQNVEPVEM